MSSEIRDLVLNLVNLSKGQLISKCPFGVIVWTKISTGTYDIEDFFKTGAQA